MIIFVLMRNMYIKIITCIALIAIFLLQVIWLYNTYSFLDKEVKGKLENIFVRSIEKEIYLRLDNTTTQTKKDDVVDGTRPDNDFYLNALAFHEYLLSYDISFSLEDMDSIWRQKLADEDLGDIDYLL